MSQKQWRLNTTPKDKSIKSTMLIVGSCALLIHMTAAGKAYAACSNPTATNGAWEYFASEKIFLYCDGTNWIFETNEILDTHYGASTQYDKYVRIVDSCSDTAGTMASVTTANGGDVDICFEIDEIAGIT